MNFPMKRSKTYLLKKSPRKTKKYQLVGSGVNIHFGAKGYQDYTTHHDDQRKERYIKRHSNEDWTKINAGSLSRYILWNKKTLTASVKDFEKRFGVKVKIVK